MRQCIVRLAIGAFSLLAWSRVDALPSDVRSGHWAANAVSQALNNGVMSLDSDHQFHGEAKVTRAQVLIALAKLAKTVETNQWHAVKSAPLPTSAEGVANQGDWKRRPVTRYILASVLARFGDYMTHGITRAPADSKDTTKSELMPPKVKIALSQSSTAYQALTYLADRHEIGPQSPLIKADSATVTGAELSHAVTEMVVGLNNRLTAMGHDAEGNTPDATFHPKKGANGSH